MSIYPKAFVHDCLDQPLLFIVPSAIRVFRKMGDVAMVQSLEGIQVSNATKATNPSQPLTSSNKDISTNFSGESKVQS